MPGAGMPRAFPEQPWPTGCHVPTDKAVSLSPEGAVAFDGSDEAAGVNKTQDE